MSSSEATDRILERFAEKCRIAGGPKPGYMLRKASIQYGLDDDATAASEAALEALVARGVLTPNETADRYFLTEAGAELLSGSA